MSQHGGYSFPVLRGYGGGVFGGGYGAAPTDHIVVLAAAPDPPLYATLASLIEAGQAYALLQMPAGVAIQPTPATPAEALAQIWSWMKMWTRARIDVSAQIRPPPELLADQLVRSEGSVAGARDRARLLESSTRIPMGPQPGLVAWLDMLNRVLIQTGETVTLPPTPSEAAAGMPGRTDLVVPYAALEQWLTMGPKLFGPDALSDPTFLKALQELHEVAWVARQVKQLEGGLSLKRRLLQTDNGWDYAWFFADESEATSGPLKLNTWAPGWHQGVTAILEPPRSLVDPLLLPIQYSALNLQDRLKAKGVPPPTPGFLPTAAAFGGRTLLVVGAAAGLYWLWRNRSRLRRTRSTPRASTSLLGGNGVHVFTPEREPAARAESGLPAVLID